MLMEHFHFALPEVPKVLGIMILGPLGGARFHASTVVMIVIRVRTLVSLPKADHPKRKDGNNKTVLNLF